MSHWSENEEIQLFREYLRIPSVHPDIDYTPCIEFLKREAVNLGLPVAVYYPARPDRPVLVMTWLGLECELPSIVLNSHMDVVPVFEDKWTHPPFAAEMDEQGRIYARGSQDMKSVGMQYLGAIRALKKENVRLKRTVHLTFVPDEEIGGYLGMKAFVKSDEFEKLNVGFSLDEGVCGESDEFYLFYAERSIWQLCFKIYGQAGHGSLLLKDTVGEKARCVLNQMMTLREEQVQSLNDNPKLKLGDVTSVNLTQIKGGVQSNVIPPLMELYFDIRLAIDVDHQKFNEKLYDFCDEAGGDIEIEFQQKQPKVEPTKLDENNAYWVAFSTAVDELNLKIIPEVCPGATDSRYIRGAGIPSLGFTALNHTPILLHGNDEFVQADIYLKGIDIYKKIISLLANS